MIESEQYLKNKIVRLEARNERLEKQLVAAHGLIFVHLSRVNTLVDNLEDMMQGEG